MKTNSTPREADPLGAAQNGYNAPDAQAMTYNELRNYLDEAAKNGAYDLDQPVRLTLFPQPEKLGYYRLRIFLILADDANTDGRMIPDIQLDYVPRSQELQAASLNRMKTKGKA